MSSEATYCRVLPTFWTDPKIKRELDRDQMHLLMYFFTSPHTNMIGLHYLPLQYAENEAKLPRAEIEQSIRGKLAPFVTYDWHTEEILVHRAARHQIGEELSARDNRFKAVMRILRDTHSQLLVERFVSLYPEWPLRSVPATPPTESPALSGDNEPAVPSAGSPKALSKPLAEPLRSLSSSRDRNSTGTQQQQNPPTARELDDAVSRIIMVANNGMLQNPVLKHVEPIHTSHGSRQDVIDWLHAGVAIDTIEAAVLDKAMTYQPNGRNRQICTMRYFTQSVLEEHDREVARNTKTKPRRPKSRGAKPLPQQFDYDNASTEFEGFPQ